MARRSQRLSSASQGTPTVSHKRAASNAATASAEAKRAKAAKVTPTKSQYFKKTKASEASASSSENVATSSEDEEASEFGDESKETSSSDGEGDDYDQDSDDDPKSRRKAKPKNAQTSSPAIRTKEGELWREGVKTGLGPGTQVIIKKPKARPAGSTPYRDETIHPNTLLFLKDLKANNERQWLKSNDAEFRQAEKDWHGFVAKLTEKLVEIDDTVPELPVKDVIFRIYRDVRFSSDPTPYKLLGYDACPNWLHNGNLLKFMISRGPVERYRNKLMRLTQSSHAGLTAMVGPLRALLCANQPKQSKLRWHPDAAPMAAMRRDIDRNPRRIKDVLLDEGMRKEFLSATPKNEVKVVKAFVKSNAENALKTKPKGFDGDHPEIDLLRLRNYTIGRNLTEEEVLGRHSLDRVAELLTAMKPFITYLNSVVMPDEDPESESSDENDSSGEESE